MKDQFARRGIKVEVKGGQKQAYLIWRKMERNSIAFEQLSDIYGFRMARSRSPTATAAVGVAHTTWPSVMGRFKDYISTPKQNDYRSIHTTVVGPGTQRVELQIRTHDMHEIAEYGIAAHALYKDGRSVLDTGESRAYRGLRQIIETLSSDDSDKFLEHTKLELFQDQVFCFTPKGRLIALPRGATAIDFAYAVHTDVGNSAVGAKINGRIAPLISTLHNGDEVLITRSESRISLAALGQSRRDGPGPRRDPPRDARGGEGAIWRPRAADRRTRVRMGRGANSATPSSRARSRGWRAPRSTTSSSASGGARSIPPTSCARSIPISRRSGKPVGRSRGNESGWFGLAKATPSRVPRSRPEREQLPALPLRRVDRDIPVRFAPKGARAGERIVGIRTPGEGITIYPIHSPALVYLRRQAGSMARRALEPPQTPRRRSIRRRSWSPP